MDVQWLSYAFTTFFCLHICSTEDQSTVMNDILSPYKLGHHNPQKSHRQVRDCQPVKYGNVTHTVTPSHGQNSSTITLPITTTNRFVRDFQFSVFEKRTSMGHITFVNNPSRTISVLEPFEKGGCKENRRATVLKSSKQKKCLVAINAGFFNTHTGECHGNIGFRYLSEEDVEDTSNPFVQLVGGVGWLLRNGEVYLDESIKVECDETEETGRAREFFDVISARTVIGSDADGRVVLAQIDGQTNKFGVNLETMANFLKELGVVNAINLDGGGSATYVVNGTVVNYPTDTCSSPRYQCGRQVSSIVCAHEPECKPTNCSNHGDCVLGSCRCHENWKGAGCDQLYCGKNNCSNHGQCTSGGCVCEAGWEPPFCISQCAMGRYGTSCEGICECRNGAACEVTTGECHCLPGYRGVFCDEVCPVGFYGHNCQEACYCPGQSCFCHHVTGNCDNSNNSTDDNTYLLQTATCLSKEMVKKPEEPAVHTDQDENLYIGFVIMSSVAALSILCNMFLLCFQCACRCHSKPFHSKSRPYVRLNAAIDSE
ncbi:N-acetylglucosamine-1-phosphodiester alpha-N-acetylglucosaminidase-like [Anneissia japonica]|uniref:N-acetylglucosamine-1-phosphodiester alpha-N-acetylglucosaminidase-like n=1 Tax=Anneissia japonica TaxID=1529436 RepID=UPI001425A489|nr:N-acetylglucosamine-1-phosphodiester alpha-N-acetylglucosaminidase-like [Anneissia japonica]